MKDTPILQPLVITAITGVVYVRNERGEVRQVKEGEALTVGDTLLQGDGSVTLHDAQGKRVQIGDAEITEADPIPTELSDEDTTAESAPKNTLPKEERESASEQNLADDETEAESKDQEQNDGGFTKPTVLERNDAEVNAKIETTSFGSSQAPTFGEVDNEGQYSGKASHDDFSGSAQVKAHILGGTSGWVLDETNPAGGVLRVGGTILISNSQISSPFQPATIKTTYGELTIDAQGHWQYQAHREPAIVGLGGGDTLTDSARIVMNDGSVHQVMLTVEGINDDPKLLASAASIDEDAGLLKGQVVAVDPDTGDQVSYSSPAVVPGLSLRPDGSYIFDASHPAYQHLAAGQMQELTIPVFATDQHGGSDLGQIKIQITGTNDIPVVGGIDHAVGSVAAAQQGTIDVGGHLTVLDVDSGESSFQPQLLQGSFGVLAITKDGQWSYVANAHQPALVSLQGTQAIPEHFEVRTADGTLHSIDIKLMGQNTPAAFGGVTTGIVKEDVVGSAGGRIVVTDPNAGESSVQPEEKDTPHGHFKLAADGTWTFTLNQQHPEVQALGESAMLSEHITVGSADGTPHVVVVNIVGTNDTPVIVGAGTRAGSLTEDGAVDSVTGMIAATDTDANALLTWSVEGKAQGSYGSLAIDPTTGQWTYTLDNKLPATQSLTAGQSVQESFTVQVTDEQGATAKQTVTVSVTGTNDAPVVSSAVTLPAGTEDTSVTVTTAQLLAHATDVDAGETAQLTVENLKADHGTITENPNGTFTFAPDKDYNGPVQFSYDVTDPQGASVPQTASMNVAAVGDSAVITGQDTGDVYESAYADRSPDYQRGNIASLWNIEIHTSGKLDVIDPDAGEAKFDNNAPHYQYFGQYGGLILQPDGNWSYYASVGDDKVGRAIDALNTGETLTDTITIRSADGTTHDVKITVHGDNDRPFCSSEVQISSGTEDTDMTLTAAQLLANTMDVDTSDQGKLTIAKLRSDHGSIRDNGDGTFTFTPEKDYNGAVHFSYEVHDAHGGVTQTGATTTLVAVNDAATFSGTDSGSITEDKNVDPSSARTIMASGSLSVSDPDAGQDHLQQNQFGEHAVHDPFGGMLHISRSGNWGYEVDNARLQYLKEGDVENVVYRVRSADGTEHQITITVNGTNDAPTVSSSVTLSPGTEDQAVVLRPSDLLAHATDVDYNETRQLTVENLKADHGTVTQNPNGTFTFTPDKDYNGPVQFTYDVTDPQGASVPQTASMTLTAVDDATTLTSRDSATLTEDHNIRPGTDQLNTGWSNIDLVDPDGPASVKGVEINGKFYPWDGSGTVHNLPGTWGTFEVGALTPGGVGSGSSKVNQWLYRVDNTDPQVQALGQGETHQETMTIISSDGTRIPVTVTIRGENDGVVIDTPDAMHGHLGDVTEDLKTTVSGTVLAHDVDNHDSVSFKPQTVQDQYGTFTVSADGSWSYALDPAKTQSLHGGESRVQRFDIEAISSDGTTATQRVSVFVWGHNDRATITGTDTGTVTEDVNVHGTSHVLEFFGKLDIADPDAGQARFDTNHPSGSSQIGYTGTLGGKLVMQPDGSYAYSIDNTKPEIQQLGVGESLTDTVTVRSVDGTTHDVVITIQGTNDAPTVSSSVSLVSGTEDTGVTLQASDLLANASDVDQGAQLSVHNLTADHGQVVDNHDGTFSFTPDQDYNGPVQFSYEVRDEQGASAPQTASMDLAAVGDAAVITPGTWSGRGGQWSGDSLSATEARGITNYEHHLQGFLTVRDPDAGESRLVRVDPPMSVFRTNGQYGDFSAWPDGRWQYNYSEANLNQLREGEVVHDRFTVHSVDGTPHVIEVTLTGTNDAPYARFTHSVNGIEDQDYQMTVADFGYGDLDHGDQLAQIKLTALPDPAEGQFLLNGHAITSGQAIDAADIGNLIFRPAPDFNGDVSFKYTMTDDSGAVNAESNEVSNVIHIASVDDAPILNVDIVDTFDNILNRAEAQSANINGSLDPSISATLDSLEISDGINTVTVQGSTVRVAADGSYSATGVDLSSLNDGQLRVTAHATSFDGTKTTATDNIVKDSTTTINRSLDAASDTGTSSTDNLTKDNTPTITGSGEPGATVEISVKGAVVGSGTVDGSGHYSITTSQLPDGMNVLDIKATDSAGNVATSSLGVVVDTHVSSSMTIDMLGDADKDGAFTRAEVGSDGTITARINLSADAVAGDTLTINGQDRLLTQSHIASGHVDYEVKPGDPVMVRLTDQAGNHSQFVAGVAPNMAPEIAALTGERGTHTPVYHATLTAPGVTGGWGIQDPVTHHIGTRITGTYGSLSVNPQTGDITYDASSQSGVHKSGSPVSGTHTEHFIVTLGGQQNAQVEVVVELSGQSVHGNSGHFVQRVEVLDMNSNPVASSQHDEPEQGDTQILDVHLDFDSLGDHHSVDGETGAQSSSISAQDVLAMPDDSQEQTILEALDKQAQTAPDPVNPTSSDADSAAANPSGKTQDEGDNYTPDQSTLDSQIADQHDDQL